MPQKVLSLFLLFVWIVFCGCSPAKETGSVTIPHQYASKDEAAKLLLSHQDYYDGFSQNDLDFKMQKKNATMEEYLAFAKEQTLDFTEEEKALIDRLFSEMAKSLDEHGYVLPDLDEIKLVKTTMAEESGAGGYTHGTQIYLSADILENALHGDAISKAYYSRLLPGLLWHELFHCLTRCNPDFRSDMYRLIHFTVADKDYTIPPSVFAYHISNPDVEHHDAFATFSIEGQDRDCFIDCVTTRHFENEGDSFFDCFTTALIPTDGTDQYYTPEQADNFNDIFGENTDYVIDPEECMADNFSYAMCYGTAGPGGTGYKSPEIIEGILEYLKKD